MDQFKTKKSLEEYTKDLIYNKIGKTDSIKQKSPGRKRPGFFYAQTERIETERIPTDFARAERKEARVNFLGSKYGVFGKIYIPILGIYVFMLYI